MKCYLLLRSFFFKRGDSWPSCRYEVFQIHISWEFYSCFWQCATSTIAYGCLSIQIFFSAENSSVSTNISHYSYAFQNVPTFPSNL